MNFDINTRKLDILLYVFLLCPSNTLWKPIEKTASPSLGAVDLVKNSGFYAPKAVTVCLPYSL